MTGTTMLAAMAIGAALGAPAEAGDGRAIGRAETGAHGPALIVIDKLEKHYGAVAFDHQLHVEMCGMADGCAACHHAQHPTEEIASCERCHPADRSQATMRRPSLKGAYHRQCLGCHRDWSGSNGCGFCHTEQGVGSTLRADLLGASKAGKTGPAAGGEPDGTDFVGVDHPPMGGREKMTWHTVHEPAPVVTFHHADHTERFGLRCVECHQGGSCDRCHGPNATPMHVERERDCYSCHASDRCVVCHDAGERGRFDHGKSAGWCLSDAHQELACAACHTEAGASGETPEVAAAERFARPTTADCTACHRTSNDGSFDHAATGVTLYGSHAYYDCLRCHVGHVEGASGTSCASCHQDKRYPDDLPGRLRSAGETTAARAPAHGEGAPAQASASSGAR